ncbi:PDxFFG protein [Mycoplasma sp. 1654_15]|uniref:PDxFFG protein n=1 Tax=Mycoplasma sp. 1654_15 TaxID=2725994 RepID=UPI0014499FAC|nr:PDxFFG protein [Mycoplasma sp. 1654_15]QJB71250.1 PDxFFG protein [Mycoplasma sp. 1654_15]
MKKLTSGAKFIIATTSVVASSAAVVGGIKLYGEHNELGVYHLQLEQKDSNAVEKFGQIHSAQFQDTLGNTVADFNYTLDANDPDNKDSMVILKQRVNGKMTMSVDDFRLWYLKTHNRQTPNFVVKIGLMTFINEYFEALSPQEFVDYAKWFIENVSWGPETLSLSSFTLKKGVILNGNAITLGQHQGKRKEETNITFYPDSFFGSFPLFTNSAGRGNEPDSLTYQLNSKSFSKEQLQDYIKTIPLRLVIANYEDKLTSGGFVGLDLLKGKKFHRYDLRKALIDTLTKAKEAQKTVQSQTIKNKQLVYTNGFNDPDLISVKERKSDGSIKEKVVNNVQNKEENNDISFQVDYNELLKKVPQPNSLASTYFYVFSDQQDENLKLSELRQKFSTAVYLYAKNNKISMANNPEIVLDDQQLKKEFTVEKIININRERGSQTYRLLDNRSGRNQETVNFVLSNPDYNPKEERNFKNRKTVVFTFRPRITRQATATNNDELNSLMLAELIKETQKDLEKLSKNGFRNFFNLNLAKDKKVFLYEDNNTVNFFKSKQDAQDNFSEDYDATKIKPYTIINAEKQDKDHLNIKLVDESKYSEYLKTFNSNNTFAERLTKAAKDFSDVKKKFKELQVNKTVQSLGSYSLDYVDSSQKVNINKALLIQFLKDNKDQFVKLYQSNNIAHVENLDKLITLLSKVWDRQLAEYEINNNYLSTNAEDDTLRKITSTDKEQQIQLISEFVNASVNLLEILDQKPTPKEKTEPEFLVERQIDLSETNPNLKQAKEEFRSFKWSIDYFDRITPRMIRENDEIVNNQPTKTYTLFLDYYDSLIDTILENDPYVAKEINGTYVNQSIDPTTGETKYTLEQGKYNGFYPSDRVSFISLLKASSDKFKTTGINYLKYVGQHEYGHHQTLQYAQNISEKSKLVQSSALSSNGIAVESLYNKDILQLYLDARSSGLKIRKADALYEPSDKGLYSNYTFNKAKDDTEQRWETEKDIFGATQDQPAEDVLDNKSRRYLQSFDNLKTAADLRNLKLYDLYLLNAFDFDSGTISPQIVGKSEYFRLGDEIVSRIASKESFAKNRELNLELLEIEKPVSEQKLNKEQFADFVSDFLENVLASATKKSEEKTVVVSFDKLKTLLEKQYSIIENADINKDFSKKQAGDIYTAKVKRTLTKFYALQIKDFSSNIKDLASEFKASLEQFNKDHPDLKAEDLTKLTTPPTTTKPGKVKPPSVADLSKNLKTLQLLTKKIQYETFIKIENLISQTFEKLNESLSIKSLSADAILSSTSSANKIQTVSDAQKYSTEKLEELIKKAKNKEAGFNTISEDQIKSLENTIKILKSSANSTANSKIKIPAVLIPVDPVLSELHFAIFSLLGALQQEISDLTTSLTSEQTKISTLKSSKNLLNDEQKQQLNASEAKEQELQTKLEKYNHLLTKVNEINLNLFGENSQIQEVKDQSQGFIAGDNVKELYNNSLVDGKENIIQFDKDGQIIAGTYETYTSLDDPTKTKFKNFVPTLFYKNGKPLIDINSFDDKTSLDELKQKIRDLTKNFVDKLDMNYSNNGWDTGVELSTSAFSFSDGIANSSSPATKSKYWDFLSQMLGGEYKELFYSYDDFKDLNEKDLSFTFDLSKINSDYKVTNVFDIVKKVKDDYISQNKAADTKKEEWDQYLTNLSKEDKASATLQTLKQISRDPNLTIEKAKGRIREILDSFDKAKEANKQIIAKLEAGLKSLQSKGQLDKYKDSVFGKTQKIAAFTKVNREAIDIKSKEITKAIQKAEQKLKSQQSILSTVSHRTNNSSLEQQIKLKQQQLQNSTDEATKNSKQDIINALQRKLNFNSRLNPDSVKKDQEALQKQLKELKDQKAKYVDNNFYSYLPKTETFTFRNKDENGKVFDLDAFKRKYEFFTWESFQKLTKEQQDALKQDSFYSTKDSKDLFSEVSDLLLLKNSSFYKLMNIVLYIARQQQQVLQQELEARVNQQIQAYRIPDEAKTAIKKYIDEKIWPLTKVFDDLIAPKILDNIKIHDNKTNKEIKVSEIKFLIEMMKKYFHYLTFGNHKPQTLVSLTASSMPLGKVIKLGENEYYQNPKYDYIAKAISSNSKVVLDATHVVGDEGSSDETDATMSPLWKLLNLNYNFFKDKISRIVKQKEFLNYNQKEIVRDKVESKELTEKFFGQKGEFAFKSKEENGKKVLDKSRIYLDNWSKDEFFDQNFFVKSKENEQQTIFTTLSSFIEFISLDVFKYRVAQDANQNLHRKWDINYALTKFDLYNFILNEEKKPIFKDDFSITTEADLIAKLKLVLTDKTEEEIKDIVQTTTNNLMEKFEKSSFNLLIKNHKFSNKNIDQLFLPELGYQGFNTLELNRGQDKASNGIDALYDVDWSISSSKGKWLDYYSQIASTNSLNLDKEQILESDIEKDGQDSDSRIQKLIKRFTKDKQVDLSNASLFELQYLIGTKNILTYSETPKKSYQHWNELFDNGVRRSTTDFNLSSVSKYNSSRFEDRVGDYFSDYVYNFAESLTRDLVQTTFLPSAKTLENLPSYLKGFSEKNTGYEYFVDESISKKWLQSYTNPVSLAQGQGLGYDYVSNASIAQTYLTMFNTDLGKHYSKLLSIYRKRANEKQVLIKDSITQRLLNQVNGLNQKFNKFRDDKLNDYIWAADDKKQKLLDIKKEIKAAQDKRDEEVERLKTIATEQENKYITPTISALDDVWREFYGEFGSSSSFALVGPKSTLATNRATNQQRRVRREGYIGRSNWSNNGFFKDRFQRKVLDWQIYDENREPVKDDNLAIKDLKGNKVEDRASAVWYYTLESQGIGKQTISAIWRDNKRDQLVFWGYNKKEENDKIKYLAFEDESTGQRYFLEVNKKNTNNIFYFKKQADVSSKWTLEDEGYASWTTNWSILSTFSNALISPGVKGEKRLRAFFADENKNEIKDLLKLPTDTTYLAENGKIYTQAPVFLEKTQDNKYYLTIKNQFS